jgi:hypothetical protein
MQVKDKFNFHKFSQVVPDPTLPIVAEVRGISWVPYGADNLYPQALITPLYNASAMNKTCITSKQIYSIGEGLKTQQPSLEYVLKRINCEDESWNEVFSKATLDYIIYGGCALNVIWDEEGKTITDIYNLDFNDIRSGHLDRETDKVEWYYYSANWAFPKKDIYKPKAFKAFNPAHAKAYPNQILYFYTKTPGNKYYPVPDYSGSLTDIQIDVSVSSFHYFNLQNGLNPSMFIQFHDGIPGPEERQDLYAEIASAFSGVEGTGKFFLSFAQDKEHNMEITPIESTNDDYYITLESRITSRILTGHRITSPLLLGIKDTGGSSLSNNKDEILVSFNHFSTTVIVPIQKQMLKLFNRLFKFYGYEDELIIEPLRMFDDEGNKVGEAEVDQQI